MHMMIKTTVKPSGDNRGELRRASDCPGELTPDRGSSTAADAAAPSGRLEWAGLIGFSAGDGCFVFI
jgi:hypothetical protein